MKFIGKWLILLCIWALFLIIIFSPLLILVYFFLIRGFSD